jgi:RNA polymerase sigma factor (sigma-70 family)
VEASALSHPIGLGRISVTGPLLRLRSDEQLVALFRAGHDEAFGTIHDRYRPRLFAYARQMLGGSASDAEDVLQDVFLRAYDALRVNDRELLLRAWLYRVAHNRCIDQLRRPTPAPEDIYDLNRGPQQDLMAQAERREDLRRLVADVRRLPDQQRSALLMREMEGLSYQDLAAALDVTVPAVKSLLVRARIGLVEAIEARDTGCAEIRSDLAAAFDRGVRCAGRSRKHLRECTGCRDYRDALRHVEKTLNGLSPSAGPLAALAKILGIGGAGSGAAAGGSIVAGGGGAAVVSGSAATIGTGAVAATAGKVAAVMAAAAVVGGGATAVHQVEHHRAVAASTPVVQHVATASAATGAPRSRSDLAAHQAAIHTPAAHRGAKARHSTVAQLDERTVVSSVGTAAEADGPTTGGLQAPDDAQASGTTTAAGDADGTTTAADPSTAVTGTDATTGATADATDATAGTTAPATSTSAADTPDVDETPTAAGTGGASAPGTPPASATPPAAPAPTPVASGAAVPPPAG